MPSLAVREVERVFVAGKPEPLSVLVLGLLCAGWLTEAAAPSLGSYLRGETAFGVLAEGGREWRAALILPMAWTTAAAAYVRC